jgi:hypothetical protein
VGDAASTEKIRTALARERSDAALLAEQFAAVMLAKGIFDPLFEALARPGVRYTAMQYLIDAAPGRSAAFSRAARDADPAMRADVVNILGLSYDSAALAVVQPLKQDKDPLVARAAERAEIRLRRLQ